MKQYSIDLLSILRYLPKDNIVLNTNVKRHCSDDKEFVINIKNGKIINIEVIGQINKYISENSARSFFYEGLVSRGNKKYELMWGS